jgi:protein SCO1/2
VCCAWFAPSALAQSTQPAVAERFKEVGIYQQLGEQLPLELEFVDEHGARVPLSAYFGRRPVLLLLAYYQCPMLCNVVFNSLVETMRSLDFTPGQEFEFVVISFDPTETAKLAESKEISFQRRYQRPGATAGMHFLTGDEHAIRRITEAVGFRYFYDEASKQYAHASGIMIATPQGQLARYFYGVDYPPKDVRLGLVEASAGTIGTPVDQMLLLCFHYDPVTGRYGLAVITAIRAGGILTVLTLVGFIFISLRRERRTAAAAAVTTAPHMAGPAGLYREV